MVARQVGALTVNEKVYANWRKISVIAKRCRGENLSLSQLEAKIAAELPELTKKDIFYALRLLPVWRDTLPISYKSSPEEDHGYEPKCAYADTLPDTGTEPIDAPLLREEMRNAFTAAFVPLTAVERELFENVHGVNTKTFEIFPPVDRSKLALMNDYADESGVNKAEKKICTKITAKLCEIGFTDAVAVKKISPPNNCPTASGMIYYAYYPRCEKEDGVIVLFPVGKYAYDYEVIRTADGDTMNSRRYAEYAAKVILWQYRQDPHDKFPARVLAAQYTSAVAERGNAEQIIRRLITNKGQ